MPEVVCELFWKGVRSEITGRTLRIVPEPNGFANQTDVRVEFVQGFSFASSFKKTDKEIHYIF